MHKRWYILLLVMAVLLTSPALATSEHLIQLSFEGRGLQTPAVLIGGVTYVPLRAFFEEIGGSTVKWDNTLRQAVVTADDGTIIHFTQNSRSMSANERYFYLPDICLLRNASLWVPARGIAAALGQNITYDHMARGVSMTARRTLSHGSTYYDADAVYWLARIIHAESYGEPLQGQIAVGNVVLNRVASADFPNTIYTVIFDRNHGVQFTPVANGTIYNTPSPQAVVAAKTALEGYDVTDGCLYFFNPTSAVKAQWIIENRHFFSMIGNHAFYY